jgi:hypothetical protein
LCTRLALTCRRDGNATWNSGMGPTCARLIASRCYPSLGKSKDRGEPFCARSYSCKTYFTISRWLAARPRWRLGSEHQVKLHSSDSRSTGGSQRRTRISRAQTPALVFVEMSSLLKMTQSNLIVPSAAKRKPRPAPLPRILH